MELIIFIQRPCLGIGSYVGHFVSISTIALKSRSLPVFSASVFKLNLAAGGYTRVFLVCVCFSQLLVLSHRQVQVVSACVFAVSESLPGVWHWSISALESPSGR